MKKVLIILTMIYLAQLSALNFRPAEGEIVNFGTRDSLVYYHNNSVDQLWYGAQTWAVRFDFETYLGTTPGQQFIAEGALIYIPGNQGTDPLSVSVARDTLHQPYTIYDSLFVQQSQINYGTWNNISFTEAITDSVLWLIVDYNTNPTTQFVAASAEGGSNSYVYVNNYFYSMTSLGYQSEFLFCLYGHFDTDGTDLDVLEFDFNGNMTAGARIYPKLIVRNNSDSPALNPYLVFYLTSPENDLFLQEETSGFVHDTLFVNNIPANEIVTFDFSDSLYFGLLHSASQYRATAYIGSSSDSLTLNNSAEIEFDTFYHHLPLTVVENCLQLNNNLSTNVLTVQHDIIAPETTAIINYFADASDPPFFTIDSYNRFNYYALIGFPGTMVNGSRKIPGYFASTYSNTFTGFYNDAVYDSTFISGFELSGKINNSGYAEVKVQASNVETSVFPAFLNNCSVYVMIVEEVTDNTSLPIGFTVPVLRYIPAQFDDLTLSANSSFVDSVDFDYNLDFTTISGDLSNCRAVAILQNNVTKQIYAYDSIHFSDFQPVDIQENEISQSSGFVQIFPNPFNFNGNLRVNFNINRDLDVLELRIYNVKGQLIKKIIQSPSTTNYSFVWNGRDQNNKEVSSGIYLFKLSAQSGNDKIVKHGKCLLLKK